MRVDNFLSTYQANSLMSGARNFNQVENQTSEIKTEQDKLLKEQTDAFEAFLVKTVLDISLKNKTELFGKDASDEIYSSMYNDTMSKALSGGMGFSKLLYDFLKERG